MVVAGIPIESLSGSNTSVFAGSFSTDYSDMTLKDSYTMHDSYKTGNGIAMLSNRISHFYNFQGASMTMDVGCSTGLVALHQAVQTLRCGESDVAIVGSSLLCLSPDMFIALANSSVLGPTGKCFAWDERAEGYGRGQLLPMSKYGLPTYPKPLTYFFYRRGSCFPGAQAPCCGHS